MRVLGIDPGLRNLAFCVLDAKGEAVCTGKEDIFAGREITVDGTYDAIVGWCDRNAAMLDDADVVVIERQFCNSKFKLSACLLIMQTVLQTRSHGRCVLLHAMAVKRFYNTHAGKHAANKRAAVKRALVLVPELSLTKGKLDDIADALLLAKYHFFSSKRNGNRGKDEPGERHNTAVSTAT